MAVQTGATMKAAMLAMMERAGPFEREGGSTTMQVDEMVISRLGASVSLTLRFGGKDVMTLTETVAQGDVWQVPIEGKIPLKVV